MRIFFISIVTILSLQSFAQFQEGFNKEEARDMIAICNSFPFLDLYNDDADILPAGYTKKYTSGTFGMDNKYQIYTKGKMAVINLRGSSDKKASWLENIYFAMIPATGVIKISGKEIKYKFSKDADAAVHAGYALGVAYLEEDLLYNINNLNKEGIYHFILTGHSQGGALANMLRAYLENLSHNEISPKNKFKVYAFAAPLSGNAKFAKEYNSRYSENKTSFNIINPADPIPTLPLTYDDSTSISGNLKTLLFDNKNFSLRKVLTSGTANIFENSLINVAGALGARTSVQIAKDLGPATIPPYVKDINYSRVNNVIEIKPAVYPTMLRDSALYKKNPKSEFFKKDKKGNYIRKDVMAKGTWGFQHKPYNYYATILEMYFPEEYKTLKKKYLKENL